jgi:hypothetical protein
MSDHQEILEDAFKLRRTRPARHVVVPQIHTNAVVSDFLAPLVKFAETRDGCVAYLSVRGKTLRITLERL